MKDAFEAFVRKHPRDPLPATLTWETTDRERRPRALAGDRSRAAGRSRATPTMTPDLNEFAGAGPNLGQGAVRARAPVGPRRSRRATATRSTMTTRGVAEFTLLLSPDVFDFSKPIMVVANGQTVFDGRVEQ